MIISIENIKCQITIGGKDNLVDPNLLEHCREYMSVKVPGSFFAAKALKFHWDGMKYFLTKRGAMATGFLPVFLKFIDEEYPTLEVTINDLRQNIPQFKSEFVSKIGSQEINEQYIHQKHIIESFNNYIKFRGTSIYFPRGVADAATNAGKTAVMVGVYLNLKTEERMLIVIHRKTIYRDLVKYFESVFTEIGQINDKNYIIKPITVAMIQTMYNRIEDLNFIKDLNSFTVLAVDEAHRAGSDMYSKVLVHCPASVRLFLSGSAFDSDDIVANMVKVGLSGPKLIKVSKRYLMDRGISTPIKVHMHLCNTILYDPVVDYDDCIHKLIMESIERMSLMYEIIKGRLSTGPILVAVEKTEQGDLICKYLKQQGLITELTHSKDKEIFTKIDAFRDNEIDVLISTGVIKEGVNLPRISTIINAAGGKSKSYIKQWMGRGERIHESKSEVEFHDFYDIGRFVQKHSIERINLYKAEELEIIYHFDIKDVKRMRNVIIN
jgi:superfamily II DNA or RNA helicase